MNHLPFLAELGIKFPSRNSLDDKLGWHTFTFPLYLSVIVTFDILGLLLSLFFFFPFDFSYRLQLVTLKMGTGKERWLSPGG